MSSEKSGGLLPKRERGLYWREYYAANKETKLAYHREYRDRSGKREKARLATAAWRRANKERAAQSQRASYLKHRDKRCLSVREYQRRNRDVALERLRVYFATHPWVRRALHAARRANLLQQRCGCCGNQSLATIYDCTGEVDHKIPLALGGHHCKKNLQILTREQHLAKTAIDKRRMADVRLRSGLFAKWASN